jgi:hypothetical protein
VCRKLQAQPLSKQAAKARFPLNPLTSLWDYGSRTQSTIRASPCTRAWWPRRHFNEEAHPSSDRQILIPAQIGLFGKVAGIPIEDVVDVSIALASSGNAGQRQR